MEPLKHLIHRKRSPFPKGEGEALQVDKGSKRIKKQR